MRDERMGEIQDDVKWFQNLLASNGELSVTTRGSIRTLILDLEELFDHIDDLHAVKDKGYKCSCPRCVTARALLAKHKEKD